MSPADSATLELWLAVLFFALMCLAMEVVIEISQNHEDRARADVEKLLRKANKEITERPRIRAGTTQTSSTQSLQRNHREH